MMENRKIYINGAAQISMQKPLSEEWMTDPIMSAEPYRRSQDPNFREWLNPLESRRMGKILKRALVTASKVMKDTGVMQPDAIMTGTGLGCIENTELFLDQLCREGEEMLKPTYFMQSTHNTISSLISIQNKCHGYNITYSHKSISFDSALMDAFVQLRLGDINTALVTGNDEMTPSYFSILQRTGYVGQAGEVTAGEASVAMMLTTEAEHAFCELQEMKMVYGDAARDGMEVPVDAVMVGTNGTWQNDKIYEEIIARCYQGVPQIRYKHLFGECYTASALGIYAAACLVKEGRVPAFMRCDGVNEPLPVNRLLVINHSDGQNVSYVLMQRIS